MWMKVLILKATRAGCGRHGLGEDAEQQSYSATTKQHLPALTDTKGPTISLTLSKRPANFIKSEPTSSALCP